MDFQTMAKVELHAHLSGSLSKETIEKLLNLRKQLKKEDLPQELQLSLENDKESNMQITFEVFRAIHLLTDNYDAIQIVAKETLKEFAADNVTYLELRTTPRAVEKSYNKYQYIEAILQSMKTAEEQYDMKVRLLISLDRGKTLKENQQNYEICKEFTRHEDYGHFICGLDVSGNPSQNSLLDFVPILQDARAEGMKLAIHLLEINTSDSFLEARRLLELDLVDRIGHGTYLHPDSGGSQDLYDIVKKKNIPIEICITSNLKTDTMRDITSHHVKKLWNDRHPIVVCTDDKGVFSTTLSKEYNLFLKAIDSTSDEDLKIMREYSIQSSFLTNDDKTLLFKKINT